MAVVGVSIFELQVPQARSLKQKRKVVKGLIERIHHRFKVSIAETDFHDLHQRAEIAIALVSRTDSEATRMFEAIRGLIDMEFDSVLLAWDPQLMDISE